MSPADVPPDEMSKDPKITDEDFDGLLSGHAGAQETSLDLTRFVDDLRATFPAEARATEAHLAAIMENAQLLADKGDPVVRPASNADAPVSQVSRPPKRRRNHMKERKRRILVLRVAAPVIALFTVLGIMGSAGALPRGLQRLTSTAAGWVGADLPSGEDTEGDTDATSTDTTADDQGTDDKSDTVADDQGENDDSQGDATDDQGENDQGDDSQGDSTDATNEDDQGENDDSQGDTTSENDQGDDSQGDSTDSTSDQGDQNDQGDSTDSTSSSQDDQGDSGSGDNNQD
jgi:hypothetical protein